MPDMAAMLSIPQMASLSFETPQFSALTPLQEKVNERLATLETASQKHEIDLTELKAGLTEVREGVKSIKEELVQSRFNQRPIYQRQVRPVYPVARMPMDPFVRPYYQQGSYGARPRVVPGLTGGPGYVTNQPPPRFPEQRPQPQKLASPNQAEQAGPSPQIGSGQASPLAFPQRPPGPAIGAMEEPPKDETDPKFANPNLQFGTHDTGFGWVGNDLNDATTHGYDEHPEGMYVFSDAPF